MTLKSFLISLLGGLILAALGSNSFGQTFQWAKQIGGAGWDEGTSIKTDNNNNVYITGVFIGTVDFDPGAGVFNLTSIGEKDAFICKLDAAGNFLWAKQYGGSAYVDDKTALAIDVAGNLYITGSFLGIADFDPGPGTFNLTSIGSDRDIFVQKLDADGNFMWVKQMGAPYVPLSPTPAHSSAIAADAGGNIYITGYFDGTVDFDPHPVATFNMTTHRNTSDIFICKLDTDGNFIWARQFSGTQGQGGVGYAIDVDAAGNVYSTGTIGGRVDFDPGQDTFYLNTSAPFQTEIYVSKLDAAGNFVWAKAMGSGEGSAIAVSADNHIYSSGWFPSISTPVINKHDTAGNLLWARQLGGINGKSIVLDNTGHVYIAGSCGGTNDFDPGPGMFNLTAANSDSYISKLDTSGHFVWAGLLGGGDQVNINSITTDKDNNLYTTGFFNETADFDPSSSIFNLSSPAVGYDIFIHKLGVNNVSAVQPPSFENSIKVYPNPTEGNLTLEFEREYNGLHIVLRNVLGQEINTNVVRSHNRIEVQINESNGMYFLEIADRDSHKAVLKIIKQ